MNIFTTDDLELVCTIYIDKEGNKYAIRESKPSYCFSSASISGVGKKVEEAMKFYRETIND